MKIGIPVLCALVLACLGTPAAGDGWKLRDLVSFCAKYNCSGNGTPGPLTIDAAGHLFGSLREGGNRASGAVVEVLKFPGHNRWSLRTRYHFCALLSCRDGSMPNQAGLVVDTAGNLYGTTSNGGANDGGVFFKLSQPGTNRNWVLTVLYDFCSRNSACTDGGAPNGPLTYEGQAQGAPYDGVSPLYGTAFVLGSHRGGTVFSLTPGARGSWHEAVLFSFCGHNAYPLCPDGKQPTAVTLDGQGNLVGVAGGGPGADDAGVLFRLSPVEGEKAWSETVLHRFCSQANCADGTTPIGAPLLDQSGNMFGVTVLGGNTQCNGAGCGVLYKMTPEGDFSVLYDFCSLANCADGWAPTGTPIMDPNGVLFGTTSLGGAHHTDVLNAGGGTVFSFSGAALTTLYSFCAKSDCADGEFPIAGLVMDGAGNLYGPTQLGGSTGAGVVFQLQSPGSE